jgi:hypothetical protein
MKFTARATPRGAAKVVALAAMVVVALAVSSVASAANSVAGRYTTTIKSPAQLKGTWVLTLARGGTFTVALNGRVVSRGSYSATARTITFGRERGGSGCAGRGMYTLRKTGRTVRFIRVREAASCGGRAAVLAHRFTKVR